MRHRLRLTRRPTGGGTPLISSNDQRSYELWLIPNGETQPRSLGLVEPGHPGRLDIPASLAGRITRDATLAVSEEPTGGSRTGQPTKVIAAGKLTNL